MLKEARFGWESYANCDRFGTWDAVVDAVVYAKGARVSATGNGKRAGLHLYVRTLDEGRKIWLFVFFFPASEVYEQAQGLEAGNRIRVETVEGRQDHAVVKSLDRLA